MFDFYLKTYFTRKKNKHNQTSFKMSSSRTTSNSSSARATTTRRALNDLQYSPNGKDIVGLSPRKTNKGHMVNMSKNGLFESSANLSAKSINKFSYKLKKRTSISLPDICSTAALSESSSTTSINKSEASTPCKQLPLLKTSKRSNISIIVEEKENPNLAFNLHLEKCLMKENADKETVTATETANVKQNKPVENLREIAIQCNKSDEDMLFGDSVEQTSYWKLLSHKRYNCLIETRLENEMVCVSL
jgi:hypothetical protein